MEQKQRRAKADPSGAEQEEESALPSPPDIEDTLKAAEMAQQDQRDREGSKPIQNMTDDGLEKCCYCGVPGCAQGPFVWRAKRR